MEGRELHNNGLSEDTSLYHLINKEMLLQCHKELDGSKAVGIDEITKKEYERNLEQNIDDLVERLKRKSYKDSLKCWNTTHWHRQRYLSACFDTVNIIMKSRMRESRTYGSVRGLHCEVWVYSTVKLVNSWFPVIKIMTPLLKCSSVFFCPYFEGI